MQSSKLIKPDETKARLDGGFNREKVMSGNTQSASLSQMVRWKRSREEYLFICDLRRDLDRKTHSQFETYRTNAWWKKQLAWTQIYAYVPIRLSLWQNTFSRHKDRHFNASNFFFFSKNYKIYCTFVSELLILSKNSFYLNSCIMRIHIRRVFIYWHLRYMIHKHLCYIVLGEYCIVVAALLSQCSAK